MAFGTRFIQPGYRRSVGEALWDQKVKMSAAISGRWLPSSREIREAKVGAMTAGMKQAAEQRGMASGATTQRRMKQAGMRPEVPESDEAYKWRGTGSGKDLITAYLLKRLQEPSDYEED